MGTTNSDIADLVLIRYARNENSTEGILKLNGKYVAHTLEPRWRNIKQEGKVKGSTAIPAGTYIVDFAVSQKFKRRMPYLMNVPYFTGIMIHPGNTSKDTEGCILVGTPSYSKKGLPISGVVMNSQRTFNAIMEDLEGKNVMITIKEPQEWENKRLTQALEMLIDALANQ